MKDVSNSKWLDKAWVDAKVAENAAKAKADREQIAMRVKIATTMVRVHTARVVK